MLLPLSVGFGQCNTWLLRLSIKVTVYCMCQTFFLHFYVGKITSYVMTLLHAFLASRIMMHGEFVGFYIYMCIYYVQFGGV